jgi:hypothetical protein
MEGVEVFGNQAKAHGMNGVQISQNLQLEFSGKPRETGFGFGHTDEQYRVRITRISMIVTATVRP